MVRRSRPRSGPRPWTLASFPRNSHTMNQANVVPFKRGFRTVEERRRVAPGRRVRGAAQEHRPRRQGYISSLQLFAAFPTT